MNKTAILMLVVAACSGGAAVAPPPAPPEAAAETPATPETPTEATAPLPAPAEVIPPERADDVKSFDLVWTTIRDRHFDPKIGGLDWDAVRAELRPKVIAAKDRDEVRAILGDMIARLKLTHFGIVPMPSLADLEPEDVKEYGGVGLDVRPLDGGMVVTRVIRRRAGGQGRGQAGLDDHHRRRQGHRRAAGAGAQRPRHVDAACRPRRSAPPWARSAVRSTPPSRSASPTAAASR